AADQALHDVVVVAAERDGGHEPVGGADPVQAGVRGRAVLAGDPPLVGEVGETKVGGARAGVVCGQHQQQVLGHQLHGGQPGRPLLGHQRVDVHDGDVEIALHDTGDERAVV